MKKIRLSKSKMMAFLKCPMLFKHYYEGRQMVATAGMSYGSQVHDIIEQFWKGIVVKGDTIIVPKLETKDRYVGKSYENFRQMIDIRWNDCIKRDKIDEFFPKFIENKIEQDAEINGETVTLVGIVDMLDTIGGENIVVDWKTGKPNPKYKMDTVFYAYLMKLHGIDVNKGVIYYPYYGKADVYKLKKEDFEELIQILETMVWHIRNDKWFHNSDCDCHKIKWADEE